MKIFHLLVTVPFLSLSIFLSASIIRLHHMNAIRPTREVERVRIQEHTVSIAYCEIIAGVLRQSQGGTQYKVVTHSYLL